MWFPVSFWFTFLSLLSSTFCVDRNNFKTCEQSSFCRRCRGVKPGISPYQLDFSTLDLSASHVKAEIVNTQNLARFKFHLFGIKDNTFRMKITELSPIRERYEVENVLVRDPEIEKFQVKDQSDESVSLQVGSKLVKLFASPFHLDIYNGENLIIRANARGLMKFEHHRPKSEPNQGEQQNEDGNQQDKPSVVDDDIASDPGAWEENFKSHHDTKPYGPSAVALDFTFFGAQYAYGIPEHAESFALKSTKNSDPYRLYNLDVFEYELWNGMALYGSIPFLIAHGPEHTSGLLWLNAAETWIDILGTGDQNVVSSFVNFVSGSVSVPQIETHFMSESGIIDVFFMLGPKPKDIFRQYTELTGTAPLPQYFALGYHQSRWNYNDQDDVRNVEAKFDEHDLPMDVMWLDIEHTDSKKYFTWDHLRFPQPTEMTNNLTAKGRKLVVIVDPHIKRDGSYFLHNDAEANGYYVKNKDGKDFEGWCWPGSSSYLDLLNPAVREYYGSRYLLENFIGSTLDTHIWNDMNEPSVFNGPEVTMPKDCVHFGGWEHRDVHNIYGLYYTMATFNGLLQRSQNRIRPFLLTRSHFAGSQRFAAVWTGDNFAEWDHLRITVPMCLSLSVSGISFCGADVGGFFKNPDAELITRWYQAAAFQPFFRAHSHIDTKRREPWLFDEDTVSLIREALRRRYALLPFWYTLFWEHELTGSPVMRPLWAEFPSEITSYPIDNEYLLGDKLLIHPVVESRATSVNVYFPGQNEIWYDCDTYEAFEGGRFQQIPVSMRKIPVFQRGGTVVPKKERIRRSSILGLDDPYTLLVAMGQNGSANGTLFFDDGYSYEYKDGKFVYLILKFDGKTLTSKFINEARYPSKSWLERVVIIGWPSAGTKAYVKSKDMDQMQLETSYISEAKVLVIRKPAVSMIQEWTITLQ